MDAVVAITGPKPRTPILDTGPVPVEKGEVCVVEITGSDEEVVVVVALNLDHALTWYKHHRPEETVICARVLAEDAVLLSETREL